MQPSRLLTRFEGDPAPTLDALVGRLLQTFLASLRAHEMDGGDAKLRRLLEQQFQSIELEERNEQMHRQLRRRIRKPFRDPESHLGFPRSFDLREIKGAIIRYFED